MVTQGASAIGIDGGGTSCRVALLWRGTRHEAVLGPANVSTGFEAAIAVIRDGLVQVAARAGVAPPALDDLPAHLGLAGVMGARIARRVADALPLRHVAVTDDRPTTIAGALGPDDGAVAAIGTGSFLGLQRAGQISGLGGWGFYIGDHAAGAWLMRRCLEETMLAIDGLRPETGLTRAVLARHGDDPAQIVLFSMTARPADFAAAARDIWAAAGQGDALALALVDEGAAYIRAGLGRLGWVPGMPLVFAGGLGPQYAQHMGLAATPARGSALDGALALALRGAS